TAAGIVAICVAASNAWAGFPNGCAAAKEKYVAADAYALLRCYYHADLHGYVDAGCVTIVDTALGNHFASAESRYQCFTTNDSGTMQGNIDAFVTDVVQTLDPAYPPPTI